MCPDYDTNPGAAGRPGDRAREGNIAGSATPPTTNVSSPNLSTGADSGSHAGSSGQHSQTAEQIRRQADEMSRQARERGASMLREQKGNAAEQVDCVARALHQTADNLRDEQPQTARYVERAAEGLERFSRTLRERDVDALYSDARNFARRQPALVIGGTIAAGFLLSRFLKSSAPESDYADRAAAGTYTGTDTYAGTGYATPPAGAGREH